MFQEFARKRIHRGDQPLALRLCLGARVYDPLVIGRHPCYLPAATIRWERPPQGYQATRAHEKQLKHKKEARENQTGLKRSTREMNILPPSSGASKPNCNCTSRQTVAALVDGPDLVGISRGALGRQAGTPRHSTQLVAASPHLTSPVAPREPQCSVRHQTSAPQARPAPRSTRRPCRYTPGSFAASQRPHTGCGALGRPHRLDHQPCRGPAFNISSAAYTQFGPST